MPDRLHRYDGEAISVTWDRRRRIRCGASADKPFCGGSHETIGLRAE